YSFDGVLAIGLLIICTCAYMRHIPKLREWLLTEKKGLMGVLYKASIIGTRLHWMVSLSCIAMSLYILILK
ncbi:uncharacterized protein TRIADDRAFT_25901, partial [Trichoplax adhaerens]